MTRKTSVMVLLIGMAVSVVIVIVTITGSVKKQRTKAENMAEVTQVTIKPVEIGYYLKVYENELAVFRGESKTPFKRLGVNLSCMSDEDKLMLENGIFVHTEKELKALIEDYTS